MKFRHSLIPCMLLAGMSLPIAAQQVEINGVHLGMTITEAQQTLGPGYGLMRAPRKDGQDQVILLKQDVGYSLIAGTTGHIYWISYGHFFPQGMELDRAKTEADLMTRFGPTPTAWSTNSKEMEWAYADNQARIPWNSSCGGGRKQMFTGMGFYDHFKPTLLKNVDGMTLPESFASSGPLCSIAVTAQSIPVQNNPALIRELDITLFDHQAVLSGFNQNKAAEQQKRQADINAAKQRSSPF